jgi:hypothetical protein
MRPFYNIPLILGSQILLFVPYQSFIWLPLV